MPGRTDVLWAVGRVLDAGSLDELFDHVDDRAATVREVLADLAGGRGGRWYGTLARAARRRGVAPAWAAGRAAMLHAALEARGRDDLYRALGVPPLAPPDVLAARWRAIERGATARAGRESASMRAAREAWELLREPARRAAYERWWRRAHAPLDPDQCRSASAGGSGTGPSAAASDASAAAVASSNAARSSGGTAFDGTAASRARPSRSSRRAPRRLP